MTAELELHPRNTGFTWRDPDGQPDLLTPTQRESYCRDGGFVLTGAFSEPEIDTVVAAIDPLEAQAQALLEAADGGRFGIARANEIVFSPHLVARSDVLKNFARHPLLIRLTKELLGSRPRLYWDQLVYKKPGTTDEFPWHQDNGYTYVEPQQYLTCWVALTDATVDNGCPWIVPGVHQYGTLAHRWTDLGFQCFPDHPRAQPMPARKGDIVVFSSLTPHRTGPNLTDSIRKSYILQYTADGATMFPHNQPAQPADNPDWQFLLEVDDDNQDRASQ